MEKKLQTGDIVLFSMRSYCGRDVRYKTRSLFAHCGILIKSELANDLFILEVAVQRKSLWNAQVCIFVTVIDW